MLCNIGSVADQDPGSGAFLTPGTGIRDLNIPDHLSKCSETVFLGLKITKFFDADPESY
jgi:hypothetical protein